MIDAPELLRKPSRFAEVDLLATYTQAVPYSWE
jgi:hypothetical protein